MRVKERVVTYTRKGQTMERKMNIKLNGKNAVERIGAEIERVETRCTARTIGAATPAFAAERIENMLDIPKKYLDGITAYVDFWASTFPNAYKYVPESTQFKLENRKGNWYLVDVWRGRVQSPTNAYRLNLPETAQTAIVDSYRHFGK